MKEIIKSILPSAFKQKLSHLKKKHDIRVEASLTLLECSPKIGPFNMLGFPQPEEDWHEDEAIFGRADCADSAGCGHEND